MATELATRQSRHLAAVEPIDEYRPLDVYAGGPAEEEARVDALATISAGYRARTEDGKPGMPKRSEDGTIYVHGDEARVPNLIEALRLRDKKGLTITFPSDNPRDFIVEFFARYSATRLEAFGDAEKVTTIKMQGENPVRATYYKHRAPEKYDAVIQTCKAYHRIFFYLMVWEHGRPLIDLSDGLAPYALRTTSRGTMRNLLGALRFTKAYTQGRIKGIPFEVAIDPKRETVGSDGSKRRVPVFTFATKTPQGIKLTSETWAALATGGLAQGLALSLPAGEEVTWEDAEAQGPFAEVEDVDDATASLMERGGPCDAAFWQKAWFARAKGTRLDSDEARAQFLFEKTDGRFNSLTTFLYHASENEAAALIAAAADYTRDVDTTTGEIIEPEPEPAEAEPEAYSPDEVEMASAASDVIQQAPQEDMVTSPRDKLYQAWATLVQQAVPLGITPPDIELPISVERLTTWGKTLRLGVENAKAQRARNEAKAKQPAPAAGIDSEEEL